MSQTNSSTVRQSQTNQSQTNQSCNESAQQYSQAAKDMLDSAAQTAATNARQAGEYYVAEPASDLMTALSDYAKRKPDVAAMWCFGLGLLVGWRLRG